MAELNITFAGIITHLDGIVPGVPMRAVVPNALSVRFGEIWIPDPLTLLPHRKEYYLMPHVAYISDARGSTPRRCGLPQVVDGRYLKIVNAMGERLHFAHKGGFSLSEFVHDLRLDDDVVFGGNAACYFDIFRGCAWTEGEGNMPRTTRVRMETDGAPRLAIEAMPGSGPDVCGDYYEIEIQPNAAGAYELFVTNLDYDPATEYRNFDFLMNYLVAKGGIPRVLKKPTPGMPPDPEDLTMRYLGEKLKALGEFIKTDGGTVAGYLEAGGGIKLEDVSTNPAPSRARYSSLAERLTAGVQAPVPLDESCSDSHVP
ncbi:MAG TPA: hypothetical protein VHX14_22020 [Thermoanaerobaculia bacterium]|nr:hypothetical protein [Thermoanaerobaculia bacterium]